MASDETYEARLNRIYYEASGEFYAKGADYHREEDILSNFRQVAAALDVPVRQVWAVHFYKQVSALLAWARTGKLNSETFDGRVIDLVNYLVFASLIKDEEDQNA